MQMRDKRLVAASFSRAAVTYDAVAQLQRDVADCLADWLPDSQLCQVVDLGSGTGYASQWLNELTENPLLNLDLAEGMLSFARDQGHQGFYVAGDAEALPLADQSVDLIWSSLALQWSENPEALFAELSRVLKPGGRILLSTLGEGTLNELRTSWSTVDQHVHVNRFERIDNWLALAQELTLLRHKTQIRTERYHDLSKLLRELKYLGAHNVNSQRRSGLGGQSGLKAMFQAYERFRDVDGYLPASYEVHYIEFIRR